MEIFDPYTAERTRKVYKQKVIIPTYTYAYTWCAAERAMYIKDLPLPEAGVIRHICHLSDIHIRPGIDSKDEKSSRFSEYITVFRRIARFLEEQNAQKDIVICITGDLLHDNRKAGAPCIELFYEIIDILAAVAPVYIIRGNHDYNQASLDTQDLITALMYGLRARPNVAYLDRTGQYNAANVCFGLVAIQDAVKAGHTNGSVCYENVPAFPRLVHAENKTHVALFHGDVFKPPTTLDWILEGGAKYDFVMLGDLHNQHVSGGAPLCCHSMEGGVPRLDVAEIASYTQRAPTMWAYAGSPIQQNFGEPLFGHGFLMWDVSQKTLKVYHVRNDFAFLTAYIDHTRENREIMFQVTFAKNQQIACTPHTIAQLKERAWMPRRIRLKIKKHPTWHTLQDTLDIHQQLEQHGFTLESSQEILHLNKNGNDAAPGREENKDLLDIDLHAYNQPSAWAEFVRQNADASSCALSYDKWDDWFHHPDSLFLQENAVEEGVLNVHVRQDIKDKNKKIAQALQTYRATSDHIASSHTSHTRFDILYMNWSYILCFDADCHFDFQALHGNVHCLGAKNGFGKTSFLETILIALFGEGFPSRNAKHMSSSIISVQQNRGWTSIVVKLDNTVYRIKRLFTKVPKDAQKIQAKDVSLEVLEEGDTFREIQSGKKATTEWIHKHIGTLDMFLTSCMVSQTSENEFFAKKPPEQKAYLDEQLKLHASSAFMALLKTAKSAYSDIAKRVADIIEMTQHDVKTPQLQQQHRENTDALQGIRASVDRIKEMQKRLQPCVSKMTDSSLLDMPRDALSDEKDELLHQVESIKTVVCGGTHIEDVSKELTIVRDKFEREHREYYRPGVDMDAIKTEMRTHEHRKPKHPKPLDHAASVDQKIQKLRGILRHKNIPDLHDRWRKGHQRARALEHELARRTTDLQRLEKDKTDAQERHTRLQNELSQHLASQPPPPSYTKAQYENWCRALEHFEDAYGNMDALMNMLQRLEDNKPPRPQLSASQIDKQTQSLERFITKTRENLSPFYTSSEKTPMWEELDQEMERVSACVNTIKADVDTREAEMRRIEADHKKKTEAYQTVLVQKPTEPCFTHDSTQKRHRANQFASLRSELEVWQRRREHAFTSDELHKARRIVQEYPGDIARLSSIRQQTTNVKSLLEQCIDYKFNPRCNACKNHPWNVQRTRFIDQLSRLEEQEAQVSDHIASTYGDKYAGDDVSTAETCIDEARAYIQLHERYHEMLSLWVREQAFWATEAKSVKAFEAWQTQKRRHENDLHETQERLSRQRQDVKNAHVRHQEKRALYDALRDVSADWKHTFSEIHHTVEINKQALRDWEPWEAKHAKQVNDKQAWAQLLEQKEAQLSAKRARDMHDDWNAHMSALNAQVTHALTAYTETANKTRQCAQDLEKSAASFQESSKSLHALGLECETCKSCEEELLEHEKTIRDITEHDRWQTSMEQLSQRVLAHDVHQKMAELQEVLNAMSTIQQLEGRIAELAFYLEHYQDYHAYHKNLQEIEVFQEKKVETLSRISLLEKEIDVAADRESKITKLVDYHALISSERTTASHILDVFSSFKDWLMRAKIIPILLEQVNIILGDLCQQHRTLQLRCEIEDASGNLIWSLADQHNMIPLEKASGFQKATVNLVMRIILGKLGVSGIKNAQLFIDEGFTSCDSANLEIVPLVLENLLHKYASILLVTHLENLKAHIPSSIDISRNEHTGYSKIQHGSTLHPFDVSRKRGRAKNFKNVF